MKTTENVRKLAAEQGIAEEGAVTRGMATKSKDFVEEGAEVGVSIRRVVFRCLLLFTFGSVAFGADIVVSLMDRTGRLAWTNAFPAGVTTVESVDALTGISNGQWSIGRSYVDPAGIIHRWMNGSSADNKRVGDGQWFFANPNLAKVSRVRAVNTDPFGNLIVTESNFGYVRWIRFQRLTP